mgnify:CR=1 FL=1
MIHIPETGTCPLLQPYHVSRGKLFVRERFDNFEFVDTSELAYGLPERSYKSFIQASEEAAISRFYGGIHYMMAITEGVEQGEKIGDYRRMILTFTRHNWSRLVVNLVSACKMYI